jgi:H+/Cl- antiporter ClcA
MLTFLVFLFIAIFAAIIGFVAFELVEETRGSHHKLMDRYHE